MDDPRINEVLAALVLKQKEQDREMDYIMEMVCALVNPNTAEGLYTHFRQRQKAYAKAGEEVGSLRAVLQAIADARKQS